MELLAKFDPDESLEIHIKKCLKVFKDIINFKKPTIENICRRYKVGVYKYLNDCFLSIFFHDFGKGITEFQTCRCGNNKFKKVKNNLICTKCRSIKRSAYPHPLASVPFVDKNTLSYYFESLTGRKKVNLCTLSVASHHTVLHKDLYLGYQEHVPKYYEKELRSLLTKANDFYSDCFNTRISRNIRTPNTDEISPYNILKENFLVTSGGNRLRDLYLLQKGIINYCDWVASGHYIDFKHFLSFGKELIETKLKEKTKKQFNWYDYQVKALNTKGNCFIRAPCGDGKTEASLLWASNNLKNSRKIIYLLPTRVSTNKMWYRLRDFFNENAGVSHSYATYELKKEYKTEEENVDDEVRRRLLLNKTFIRPLTVTTVDHLLYCMFNHGRWDVSLSNAYNSLIVLDEIHCYDFYTLGLIYKMIGMLKGYDVKFCLMSATFPRFLEKELENILGEKNYTLITVSNTLDKKLFEKKTVFLHKVEDIIENAITEIVNKYNKGQKVLVICNTIEKSKEIYSKLDKKDIKNIMLYNSEFTVKDRSDKEDELEKIGGPYSKFRGGFIAVTTQVVEVSLNLDFDVLFTEIAPIDAIVQRIGRVNRKGNKSICDVFVFNYNKSHPYSEKILDESWSLLKEGELKYKNYKSLVDSLYVEDNIDYDSIKEGKKKIKEILDKLSWIYRCNLSNKSIEAETRRGEISYIEVIPRKIDGKYIDPTNDFKIDNLLKIAYWKVRNKLEFENGWVIANINYNRKYGVKSQNGQSNYTT